MYLYNTLTKKIEKFKPLKKNQVSLYTCGPTVYDYTHIGHLRSYVNNDLLKRTLNYLGYKVKHIMNITDVGHLTGDDDTGIDKLEKGAKKTGQTVWQVAKFYTDFFLKSIKAVNIILPDVVCPATQHIQSMIELIKKLEKKGFTYKTKEAIYFDISKFKKYGQLSHQKIEEKIKQAREEVYVDPEKKHPADFALWFFCVGRFANHIMRWPSPWGEGFPGWHIECSAMSMNYLGPTIDIHAGGIEHIPIHHENEIAQAEAATNKPFVRFWFHNHFLVINGKKMSKSLKNFYTLDDLKKKNIEPLALRYLFLQSHYRQTLNFTWKSIKSSQEAFIHLKNIIYHLKQLYQPAKKLTLTAKKYQNEFKNTISNDLQIPKALAFSWQMLKSKISPEEKLYLITNFDQVFGLKINEIKPKPIPKIIIELAKKREQARQKKDFNQADLLRKKIKDQGYLIEDSLEGFNLKKI